MQHKCPSAFCQAPGFLSAEVADQPHKKARAKPRNKSMLRIHCDRQNGPNTPEDAPKQHYYVAPSTPLAVELASAFSEGLPVCKVLGLGKALGQIDTIGMSSGTDWKRCSA